MLIQELTRVFDYGVRSMSSVSVGLYAAILAAATIGAGCREPAASAAAACGLESDNPGATTGRLLVTNQQAQSASIVDLETGAVSTISLPGASPHGGAVSEDGEWGLVADYGHGGQGTGHRLFVIDMAEQRVAHTIAGGSYQLLHDIAFVGRSARAVVTAQQTNQVIEVDLPSGTILGAMPTGGRGSHSLAIAADGRTLFTANEEETFVSQLDVATRTLVGQVDLGVHPYGIAITPDARFVLVGTMGAVKVIDVESRAVVASVPGPAFPDDIAISADGTRAAVADQRANQVYFLDIGERRPLSSIAVILSSIAVDRPHSVFIHSDNRTMYATLGHQNVVAVLDGVTGCVVRRFPTRTWPDEVAWGPKAP
jgi:YVTN family beta-propeller protein